MNNLANRMIDTAVYWAPGVPDGYGGASFGTAVEIACVWQENSSIKKGNSGQEPKEETLSESYIITNTNIEIGGYLYHGELSDLPSEHGNPVAIQQAFRVHAVAPKRGINTTDIIYYQITLNK